MKFYDLANKIIQGSALEKLKELPNESVDCIITSPPYWALRDYKVDGQIGVEKTIDEYINNLIKIFDECKRVLKKEGTCWIVLGDTYSGNRGELGDKIYKRKDFWITKRPKTDIPDKSLCLIPERFAIKMIDSGWILRNKIIWHKRNCMPSSAKDRFTIDYEYIYFFTKSQKYYFKTQYEPSETYDPNNRFRHNTPLKYKNYRDSNVRQRDNRDLHPNGHYRIKRSVWSINTVGLKEAHFAVFPEELVKQCLDAGCPSEICIKCKKIKEMIFKSDNPSKIFADKDGLVSANHIQKTSNPQSSKSLHRQKNGVYSTAKFMGYDSCGCNAGFESGIVLDPFMGSGTTALVALKHNRKFVGIELNKDYVSMCLKRIDPYLKQQKLIM